MKQNAVFLTYGGIFLPASRALRYFSRISSGIMPLAQIFEHDVSTPNNEVVPYKYL